MIQDVILDNDGRAKFSRAYKRVSPSGIRTFTGNSVDTSKDVLTRDLNWMHGISPWTKSTWKTIFRNAYHALQLFVTVFVDGTMVQGYSQYHESNIMEDDIQIADADARHEWSGLAEGDRFYVFDKTLYVCLKGDDAPFKNLPKQLHGLCSTFLCVSFWNCALSHCTHSGIATLITGESSHSKKIIDLHQQQIGQLAATNKVIGWSDKKRCWCCFRYRYFQNGDWQFSHVVWHRTLGPTGNHFLHGITEFQNGQPYMIHNDMQSLYRALQADIDIANYDPDLTELQRQQFNGFVLTNDAIAQYFGDLVENAINDLKQANPDADWSFEAEHDVRRSVADRLCTAILYKPLYNGIFSTIWEIFHGFMQNVSQSVRLFAKLTYIEWDWEPSRVLLVIKGIGMLLFVSVQ